MLVPLVILFFAGFQMISHAFSTMRIASYIYHVIEPTDENLRWETYMHLYRNKVKGSRLLSSLSWPSYEIVVIGAGLICCVLSLAFAFPLNQKGLVTFVIAPGVILAAVATILWITFSIYFHRKMNLAVSGVLDEELSSLWNKVAEEAND